MSRLSTGQGILRHILERAGEIPTDTAGDYYTITQNYIQRAIDAIHIAAPFPFALKHPPGIISLTDKVTGTIDSISGTTWTASTTVTASQTGKKITLDSEDVVYRITAHTAGTAVFTVDATYTESTSTGAFTIFQDEYALASDCLRPWYGWFRNSPQEVVRFISGEEGNEFYPDRTTFSNYSTYTLSIVQHDSNNVPLVRIIPWTEEDATIEYQYSFKPAALTYDAVSGTDTPSVPSIDLFTVADLALFFLMVDKNDNRADGYYNAYKAGLRAMVNLYIGQQNPRFTVRPSANLGVR